MTDKELDTNSNTIGEEHNIIDNKADENLDHMITDTLHEIQNKLGNLQNTIIENTINTQVEQDNTIQEKTIETDITIDGVNKEVLLLKEQIEKQDQTSTKRKSMLQESLGKRDNTLTEIYPTQTEIDANRLKASQNPTILWQQASLSNYTNPLVRALMTPIIRTAQRLGRKTQET